MAYTHFSAGAAVSLFYYSAAKCQGKAGNFLKHGTAVPEPSSGVLLCFAMGDPCWPFPGDAFYPLTAPILLGTWIDIRQGIWTRCGAAWTTWVFSV